MKKLKPKRRVPHFRTSSRLGTPEFLDHGFLDPRSHVVTRSGQVILRGADKTDLRRRVYIRAQGRCEIFTEGKLCGKFAKWDGLGHGELVHKKAVGNGGSDTEENCQWGCAICHRRRDHPGVQWTKKEAAA